MFTFVFQSRANRETLKDFNARLREFCSENAVVSMDATTFGANLIIQGTTADDIDAEEVPTFTATVRTIDPLDNDLEEQLEGLIAQERDKHPKEGEEETRDPNMPVKFVVCSGEKRSWVVILCINGVAEDGEDDGGGGDEGQGPEPVLLPDPSVGFQA